MDKYNKIIANHLRAVTNTKEEMSDEDIIATYGGDTSNKIIANFDNGFYLYESIDSSITVYTLINWHVPSNSFSCEKID